jgi:hypothetical protein
MHGQTILTMPTYTIKKACRHHHSEQINKKLKL